MLISNNIKLNNKMEDPILKNFIIDGRYISYQMKLSPVMDGLIDDNDDDEIIMSNIGVTIDFFIYNNDPEK